VEATAGHCELTVRFHCKPGFIQQPVRIGINLLTEHGQFCGVSFGKFFSHIFWEDAEGRWSEGGLRGSAQLMWKVEELVILQICCCVLRVTLSTEFLAPTTTTVIR
jgi:hypothetical protein